MILKRALLIPDTHRPYHDKKAYALMLRVARDFKPQEIYLLGDYADFYSVTAHQKDPKLVNMLQDELVDVRQGLSQLVKLFPRTKIKYILGNHEHRLFRYLVSKAPELLDSLNIESMLVPDSPKFARERGAIEFIQYNPAQRTSVMKSRLYARHEPLGASPKATISKSLCSLVYGHIHRIEETYAVGMNGKPITAFSVGWLGNKHSNAFNYVKAHHQWQLGFGLVYVNPKTKDFYHNKIHILDNYSCVVNGKLYK